MLTFFTFVAMIILFVLYNTVVIVPMRESYVVQRLGKFKKVLDPGFHFLIPFFDSIAYKHEIMMLKSSWWVHLLVNANSN